MSENKDKKEKTGFMERTGSTKELLAGLNAQTSTKAPEKNIEQAKESGYDEEGSVELLIETPADDMPFEGDATNKLKDLLQEKDTGKMALKGVYLRADQIKAIDKFTKRSKKGLSEFVRDSLDIVLSELEKMDKK